MSQIWGLNYRVFRGSSKYQKHRALLQTLRIQGSTRLYAMETNLPWCLPGFQVLKIFSSETYQAGVMNVPF